MKHSIPRGCLLPLLFMLSLHHRREKTICLKVVLSMLWLKQTRNLLEKQHWPMFMSYPKNDLPSNIRICHLVWLQSEDGKGLSDLETVPLVKRLTNLQCSDDLKVVIIHFPPIKTSAMPVTYYLIFYIPKIICSVKIIMLVLSKSGKAVISKERLQLC